MTDNDRTEALPPMTLEVSLELVTKLTAERDAERAKVAELEGAADLLAQVLISVDAFGIVLQTSLGESANRLCRALWVNRPAIWRDRCVHVEGSPQRRDNDTLRADLAKLKGVLAGANRKSIKAKNRHDYMELLYERDDLIIERDTLRASLAAQASTARAFLAKYGATK